MIDHRFIDRLVLLCLVTVACASNPSPELQFRFDAPAWSTSSSSRADVSSSLQDGQREFTLRHIYHHGTYDYPGLARYVDIPRGTQMVLLDDEAATTPAQSTFLVSSRSTRIQRMVDRSRQSIDEVLGHARWFGSPMMLPDDAWSLDQISGPNTSDKSTVLSFARMAANAYVTEPFTRDWQDVAGGFNHSDSFGWDLDGLRGHIYADQTNSTVVIGIKGTSVTFFGGNDTDHPDKINDNIFGSCCCGQGGQWMWQQACSCMTSAYTCNSTCLYNSLQQKDRYYSAARDLYHQVLERYPGSNIWVTGHSLGGVVSALLGLTYGLPVMTFEAYPDALPASRLHLPAPPGYRTGSYQQPSDSGIYHYGHTADPIFMGSCNSAFAFCTWKGYAFEGLCHTGKICQYDTVNDLGWRVSARTHGILGVIKDVLQRYEEVPACIVDVDCSDCSKWKFFNSNSSNDGPVTSTGITSYTRTRTATCKTPGWWGCLDQTSTSPTSSTSTSSDTTSTCKTPGWFGCRDSHTTTSVSMTSYQSPSSVDQGILTAFSSVKPTGIMNANPSLSGI